MRVRFLDVVLLLCACKTSNDGGSGGSTAAPPGSSPTVASATGATTGASSPPATGDGATLKLASGATLKMPAEATLTPMKNPEKRLPGVVQAAHKYQLGSSKRLLLVNEMDREGLACDALLDRELDRANKAKGDEDPQKLALRRMEGISAIEVGGERALYAESKNSTPSPTGETSPGVGVATLVMCRGNDFVVMMYASDQAELPEGTKKMLTDVAASYAPPG